MRSILIVSRTSPETTALAERLEQAGYLVLTVEQVDDAVDSLTALVPGAILIDLPLSQVRRLIRQLRAAPQLRGIPRLLLASDPFASRLPPVAAVFPRPVDPDHLIRALPALYPSAITTLALQAPQPGQREERIQQALDHLQTPPEPIPAETPPVTVGFTRRRSARRHQPAAALAAP